MDSSIHMLLASTHAQERIRQITEAAPANGHKRRPRQTTTPTAPRRPWVRRSAARIASLDPNH